MHNTKSGNTTHSDQSIMAMEVLVFSEDSRVNAYIAKQFDIMTISELIEHVGGIHCFTTLFIRGELFTIWDNGECDFIDSVLSMVSVKRGKPICPQGVLHSYNRINGTPRRSGLYRRSIYRRISRARVYRRPSFIQYLRESVLDWDYPVKKRCRRSKELENASYMNWRSSNEHSCWKRHRKTQYKDRNKERD